MGSQAEFELTDAAADGISNVVFAHKSDMLLVSSWDQNVRLFDGRKNVLKAKYEQNGSVLDCAFSSDDTKAFSGGLDKTVTAFDFQSSRKKILGSHEGAVKCVEYSEFTGLVVSGSWDGTVKLWDPRAPQALAGSTDLPQQAKVYTMSLNNNKLVVGTSGRQVAIYDVRQLGSPEQVRESSLMNQTRCIRVFPNGAGYALSSIEGRVAIEFFDPSPSVQKKKYAFKCHRKTEGKVQTLYPVNAIAFHPTHGTFATGGCDGTVNVWDGENKKRICHYPSYATSIAALDFNRTGDLLAVAVSYTYEEGEKDHPQDTVYVRNVNDNEVKKKKKTSK